MHLKTISASKRLVLFFVILIATGGCKKFLEEKPLKNLVVPESINDLQALLDKHNVMNEQSTPIVADIASDEYYLTSANLQSANIFERQNYLWQDDATHLNSWRQPYQKSIYYSNVVLDQVDKVNLRSGEQSAYNRVKGSALFYRSYTFYHLAQVYCQPYAANSSGGPGLVLRLSAAIEIPSVRSSVAETYNQIIFDLKQAAELLPETEQFPTRPTRAAAFGALAKVYLSMRDYENANRYADSFLIRRSDLIDFNTVDTVGNFPFVRFNNETVFFSYPVIPGILNPSRAKIDTFLLALYDATDLRKPVFYKKNPDNSYRFKGSYAGNTGTYFPFNGISVNEIHLIKAEAAIRLNLSSEAYLWINKLLRKRFRAGSFSDLTSSNTSDLLNRILLERRKELVFRGIRWSDQRIYNLDNPVHSMQRVVGTDIFTLPANDLRWVLLIPNEVVTQSNIVQNPR